MRACRESCGANERTEGLTIVRCALCASVRAAPGEASHDAWPVAHDAVTARCGEDWGREGVCHFGDWGLYKRISARPVEPLTHATRKLEAALINSCPTILQNRLSKPPQYPGNCTHDSNDKHCSPCRNLIKSGAGVVTSAWLCRSRSDGANRKLKALTGTEARRIPAPPPLPRQREDPNSPHGRQLLGSVLRTSPTAVALAAISNGAR